MVSLRKSEFLRDSRSPIPGNVNISRVMSANKAKNTKPEILIRKAIWQSGLRGYRIHPKIIPGKPDICFNKRKIAIFVNGCFWHRCPKCKLPLPKTHTEFWVNKFKKNVKRDKQKEITLRQLGWCVIKIWECEITDNLLKNVKSLIIKKRKD